MKSYESSWTQPGEGFLKEANFEARAKERFPQINKTTLSRLVKAVKPKNQINSKRYVELGKVWDKNDLKAFGKLLTKYGV